METGYTKDDLKRIIFYDLMSWFETTDNTNNIFNPGIIYIFGFCLFGLFTIGWIIINNYLLMILFFPLSLISLFASIRRTFQGLIYKNLESYFDGKEKIINSLQALENTVRSSIWREWIDPLETYNLSEQIDDCTKSFGPLYKSLKRKKWFQIFFQWETKIDILAVLTTEREWFYAYMLVLDKNIKEWMASHAGKIQIEASKIREMQSQETSVKNVISLASIRLESHIESLEKIWVKI